MINTEIRINKHDEYCFHALFSINQLFEPIYIRQILIVSFHFILFSISFVSESSSSSSTNILKRIIYHIYLNHRSYVFYHREMNKTSAYLC